MKKILLFAAATAVALSSCSKNEVTTSMGDENPIGFSNYVGTSTKGPVTNAFVINADKSVMGVYASLEDQQADAVIAPNFMDDVAVTYDATNGWGYSPIKYWPANGVVDFYAYWPKKAVETDKASAVDATGSAGPVVTFTQATALADMSDFVYATAANQTKATIDSGTDTDGKVNFVFKHALSRIAFSAKANADYTAGDATNTKTNGTYILVKKIEVSVDEDTKVESNCDLTFTVDGATVGNATQYYAKNTAWTIFDNATGAEINATTATNFTTLSDVNGTTQLTDATASTNASAKKYIFLVPQEITKTKATDTTPESGDIKVIVTYDAVTYAGGKVDTTTPSVVTVYLPAMTFEQGKAYNFPLLVGLDAIVFGPVTVDNWGDATPAPAILSYSNQ